MPGPRTMVVEVILKPVIIIEISSNTIKAPNPATSCFDKRHELVKNNKNINSKGTSAKLFVMATLRRNEIVAGKRPAVIRL